MSTVKSISKTALSYLKPGEIPRDKDCPGLRVRANGNGSRLWCYLRRAGDQQIIKKTLGSTATFSIAEARDWARGFNAIIERGGNPHHVSAENQHAEAIERARLAMTVRLASKLYIETLEREGNHARHTLAMKRSRFNKDILARSGRPPAQ